MEAQEERLLAATFLDERTISDLQQFASELDAHAAQLEAEQCSISRPTALRSVVDPVCVCDRDHPYHFIVRATS